MLIFNMDTNQVFEEIGQFGWYQCLISLLLASSMVPAAFSNLNVVFIMGITEFWCSVPELNNTKNGTIPKLDQGDTDRNRDGYSQCTMYNRTYSEWAVNNTDTLVPEVYNNTMTISCQYGWFYNEVIYGKTATSEFNLVCDKKWLQAAAASFFAFGLFTSLLIYGLVADLFGRKPVICTCTALFIASNFATALSPGYVFLIVTRFFCGFFAAPFYGGTLVLCSELIGPNWRGHVNAWCGYFWSIAGIIMAGLAYFIRDWRHLQYTLSAIMIFSGLYILVPESPRWLYMKNKHNQADQIFTRIAKANNRLFSPTGAKGLVKKDTSTAKSKFTWNLFCTKAMIVKTLASSWNWFAASLCYYGLTYNSTSLGSNEYLSFILSMLVEVPGVVLCHFVTVKVGRKWPLAVSMSLSGIVLLFTLLPKSGSITLIALVTLGKMFCTLAINLLYVYTVELYPTVIRSMASSVGNFAARLGSIIAPFIVQLSDLNPRIPMVLFGLSSLSAGLLALLLPETIGTMLEDSLETTVNKSCQREENKKRTDRQAKEFLHNANDMSQL